MAARTSSVLMPYCDRARGLSSTRTAGQRAAADVDLAHAFDLAELLLEDGRGGVEDRLGRRGRRRQRKG